MFSLNFQGRRKVTVCFVNVAFRFYFGATKLKTKSNIAGKDIIEQSRFKMTNFIFFSNHARITQVYFVERNLSLLWSKKVTLLPRMQCEWHLV